MPSYLITGTSRGLGLGFVTELLKDPGNVVIATARDPAKSAGLQELKTKHGDAQLHVVSLDVTKQDSVHKAAEVTQKLLPNGLDYLISNAGINPGALTSLNDMDMDEFKAEIEFNVTGPMHLFREFTPLIRKSEAKKVMVITSALGSLEYSGPVEGPCDSYSIGKAALNMTTRKWSAALKKDGITTILVHPGYIGGTDMGAGIETWVQENLPDLPNLTVETSVQCCLKVMHGATPEDNGLFFNEDGTTRPW
ncbi:hypothetical protein PG990_003811 [Apiospora arundinis]|uniref:Short-chain dehydrogenase n=1 Tax=Apiospora arundinis TaxID=335852 RepID=A0ABR2IEW0_9PEZI